MWWHSRFPNAIFGTESFILYRNIYVLLIRLPTRKNSTFFLNIDFCHSFQHLKLNFLKIFPTYLNFHHITLTKIKSLEKSTNSVGEFIS